MAKITKTLIEAQKPSKDGVKGSNHLLWDSELRGFGVSIGQSRRSFVVQYRLPNGQSRRKVIGRFGLMTVEEARRQARIILGDVANGRDPVEDARSSGQG